MNITYVLLNILQIHELNLRNSALHLITICKYKWSKFNIFMVINSYFKLKLTWSINYGTINLTESTK